MEGRGVTYTINDGDISTHLPSLLESAKGIPLFTISIHAASSSRSMRSPASLSDRAGLAPPRPKSYQPDCAPAPVRWDPQQSEPYRGSLKRIDAVCGGDWWRGAWLQRCPSKDASEDQRMAAEEAVVAGYADKLREHAGGAGTWVIDVKPRADLKPFYYFVFATRYIEGMLAFGSLPH